MGRPRLWYVIYDAGRAARVCQGCDEARRLHSAWHPYTTQAAAEEAAAWHNYARDQLEQNRHKQPGDPQPERGEQP